MSSRASPEYFADAQMEQVHGTASVEAEEAIEAEGHQGKSLRPILRPLTMLRPDFELF